MLRYFAYIDEGTINSFYNQLDNNFVSKRLNKAKENSMASEVKVSIMNVIRGLFSGDGTMRISTDHLTSEETEIVNSIEFKIMKLMDLAYGNEEENIEERFFVDNRKLICGKIRVLEKQIFLEAVSKLCNEEFKDYKEFHNAFQTRNDILDRWEEIRNIKLSNNGLDILEVMNGFGKNDENSQIYEMAVISCDRPIIMPISSNKITMPHSFFRSSSLFAHTSEFQILGIVNKMDSSLNIKPLALWLNVSEDVNIKNSLADKSFWK